MAATKFDATATFKVSAGAYALQLSKIANRQFVALRLIDLCKMSLPLYRRVYNGSVQAQQIIANVLSVSFK
jgi:hypothetical protein